MIIYIDLKYAADPIEYLKKVGNSEHFVKHFKWSVSEIRNTIYTLEMNSSDQFNFKIIGPKYRNEIYYDPPHL